VTGDDWWLNQDLNYPSRVTVEVRFRARLNERIIAGAIKTSADHEPTNPTTRAPKPPASKQVNQYGIDKPPTASALPTEDNGDFGTSLFYEQRSARLFLRANSLHRATEPKAQ
jgi:hypothetical protein